MGIIEEWVYDIEVEDNHNFFANNILVHNSALEAETLHQGHIQGGISKVNTADNFIAIVQSEQMRAAGEYMFEYLKTRNSAGVGQNTLLRWDPIALRITDNVDNGQMSFVKKNEKHNVEINTNGTVFAKATNQASSLLTLMKT